MTPEELVALLDRYSKNETDLARILGVSTSTAEKYLRGTKHFPETARRLLLIVLGEVDATEFR